MSFKFNICHPDKEEIEYRDNPILATEVMNIAKNYPWIEKLKFSSWSFRVGLQFLDHLNVGRSLFCN